MLKRLPASLSLSVVFLVFLGTSSCNKSDRSKDTELQSTRDMSLALSGWNDVFRQLEIFASQQADVNTTPGPYIYDPCGTVSVVPPLPSLVFPKTMTINFGTSDCKGPDGAKRRGQLVAIFSGNYRDSLTVITVTPVNYFFNESELSGTYTFVNKGRNSNGQPWFVETILNGVSTSSLGNVNWKANYSRVWTGGNSTPVVFDDIYLISGTATGVSTDNNSFAVYINQPLQFAMNCPWIEAGTLYLNPNNIAHRYINFGTGNCDNTADVWIFGDKYTLNQY
jgi:hypothetical protein